jgi:hypothetical protein
MSYFAQVKNGIVVNVELVEQAEVDTFPDKEDWFQTSYNTRGGIHYGPNGQPDGGVALRANYAGIGYTYDSVNDVFYGPKPYASWTISAPTWIWQCPVPYPATPEGPTGKPWFWNEKAMAWEEDTPENRQNS